MAQRTTLGRILRWLLPIVPLAALAALVSMAMIGTARGKARPAEKPAMQINFARDIKPILQSNCRRCHATSHKNPVKGGFSIDTRETILEGGDSGDAVKPGKPGESRLIDLVTGPDPEMPVKGGKLTDQEIRLLKLWIEQGLPWKEGFSFADRQKVDIAPRDPKLPEAPDAVSNNPIDRMLAGYFKKHEVDPTRQIDDRTYIRRVSRDLIGLLPSPDRVKRFKQNADPDKRETLTAQLLQRRKAYATHWLTFWNDRLRNAYRGPGYIDGGRQQITQWLYRSLYENKPYDKFVQQLIDPVKGSKGFVKGIKWRGVVNASQRRELQVARSVSQVFLGTRLKCASCHDSFVDRWQLEDVYGLASVFAEKPLEIYRCDKPTGKTAKPRMIFPQLGEIDADASLEKRRQQLATMLTSKRNGRFARTIVNQLWAELMGRGIVSPVRNMAAEPWHKDLLDWLASDLVEHDYNLKRTLKLIVTSRAYQMPAQRLEDPKPANYVFKGPAVKRMSAEQFVDAVSQVTGQWQDKTGGMTGGGARGGQLTALKKIWKQQPGAASEHTIQSIWIAPAPGKGKATAGDKASSASAGKANASNATDATVRYRATVRVIRDHHHARGVVLTEGRPFTLYVNGEKVTETDAHDGPVGVDLSSQVTPGENTIAIAVEGGGGEKEAHRGLAFYAMGVVHGEPVWRLQSDEDWQATTSADANERWTASEFDAASWPAVETLGPVDGKTRDVNLAAVAEALNAGLSAKPADSLRAAVAFRDSLMKSLGRPNRSQVVMDRNTRATMLQALELTNGKTLDQMVKQGAARLVKQAPKDPAAITSRIWQRALNRAPSERELKITRSMLGKTPKPDKVADLIWAVTMLPEFQLIY